MLIETAIAIACIFLTILNVVHGVVVHRQRQTIQRLEIEVAHWRKRAETDMGVLVEACRNHGIKVEGMGFPWLDGIKRKVGT